MSQAQPSLGTSRPRQRRPKPVFQLPINDDNEEIEEDYESENEEEPKPVKSKKFSQPETQNRSRLIILKQLVPF